MQTDPKSLDSKTLLVLKLTKIYHFNSNCVFNKLKGLNKTLQKYAEPSLTMQVLLRHMSLVLIVSTGHRYTLSGYGYM